MIHQTGTININFCSGSWKDHSGDVNHILEEILKRKCWVIIDDGYHATTEDHF
jgi:hypothetical protein